ncbi:MAG: PhnD/SsuA/transferrin family substrate-binding protein [Halothiobacillaceae bacterium]
MLHEGKYRVGLSRWQVAAMASALALAMSVPTGAETDPLVLAPTLFDSRADAIRSQIGPAEFIENLLDRPVSVQNILRYEAVIAGFERDEIDLAILGPLPYVRLSQHHPQVEPLVRFRDTDGRDHYRCTLVAFADDRRPLDQYADARLALTQPYSTCGYFAAATILEQADIDVATTDFAFIGRHDQIAISVVTGGHDIGIIKDHLADRYASVGLQPLADTMPLPGFTLVANTRTLDAATREKLRRGFLALAPDHEVLRENWPANMINGTLPANDADYDAIRRDFERIQFPDGAQAPDTPPPGETSAEAMR